VYTFFGDGQANHSSSYAINFTNGTTDTKLNHLTREDLQRLPLLQRQQQKAPRQQALTLPQAAPAIDPRPEVDETPQSEYRRPSESSPTLPVLPELGPEQLQRQPSPFSPIGGADQGQGSILQNSVSAENFSAKFSSSSCGQKFLPKET
jgi:hypothetical protein